MTALLWSDEGKPAWLWLLVAGLLLVLNTCGVASKRMLLHEPDAFVYAGQARFVLSDSVSGSRALTWSVLMPDSIMLYRPDPPTAYRPPGDSRPRFQREIQRIPQGGFGIAGFTRTGGRHVPYEGTVRRVGDDLVFEPRHRSSMEAPGPEPMRLAVAEVRSLDVWDPAKQGMGVIVFLVVAVALVSLGEAAAVGYGV